MTWKQFDKWSARKMGDFYSVSVCECVFGFYADIFFYRHGKVAGYEAGQIVDSHRKALADGYRVIMAARGIHRGIETGGRRE